MLLKLKSVLIVVSLLLSFGALTAPMYVAASPVQDPTGNRTPSTDAQIKSNPPSSTDAALPTATDPAASGTDCTQVSKCTLVTRYINPFIKFLAALVGVGVTISIIMGGIQYASSAGDPQKVAAAKHRIQAALVALVTFIFLFALLNFLVPGGLI